MSAKEDLNPSLISSAMWGHVPITADLPRSENAAAIPLWDVHDKRG